MKSLEQILKEVGRLKRDLSAEIVIQEAEYETQQIPYPPSNSAKSWQDFVNGVDVEVKPRIAKPDAVKRRFAENRLDSIYRCSRWHSARYAAAKALDKETFLITSLTQLSEAVFDGEERDTDVVDHYSYAGESYGKGGWYGGSNPIEEPVYKKAFFPNEEKNMDAIKDLVHLAKLVRACGPYELIEEVYHTHKLKQVRKEAGKALDYSGLRIFFHELLFRRNQK
jgi:hypothetical protein